MTKLRAHIRYLPKTGDYDCLRAFLQVGAYLLPYDAGMAVGCSVGSQAAWDMGGSVGKHHCLKSHAFFFPLLSIMIWRSSI